jgi:hypothetical protein
MNSLQYQCIIDTGKLQFILWNQPAPFGADFSDLPHKKSRRPTPFGTGCPLLFQGLFQRPTYLASWWGPGFAGAFLYLAAAVVAAVAVIASTVIAAEPAAADDPDDEKNNDPGAAVAAVSAA